MVSQKALAKSRLILAKAREKKKLLSERNLKTAISNDKELTEKVKNDTETQKDFGISQRTNVDKEAIAEARKLLIEAHNKRLKERAKIRRERMQENVLKEQKNKIKTESLDVTNEVIKYLTKNGKIREARHIANLAYGKNKKQTKNGENQSTSSKKTSDNIRKKELEEIKQLSIVNREIYRELRRLNQTRTKQRIDIENNNGERRGRGRPRKERTGEENKRKYVGDTSNSIGGEFLMNLVTGALGGILGKSVIKKIFKGGVKSLGKLSKTVLKGIGIAGTATATVFKDFVKDKIKDIKNSFNKTSGTTGNPATRTISETARGSRGSTIITSGAAAEVESKFGSNVASKAMKIGKKLKGFTKFFKFIPGLGTLLMAGDAIYSAYEGYENSQAILNVKKVGEKEKMITATANAISSLSMGIADTRYMSDMALSVIGDRLIDRLVSKGIFAYNHGGKVTLTNQRAVLNLNRDEIQELLDTVDLSQSDRDLLQQIADKIDAKNTMAALANKSATNAQPAQNNQTDIVGLSETIEVPKSNDVSIGDLAQKAVDSKIGYYINKGNNAKYDSKGKRIYGKDIEQGYLDCSGFVNYIYSTYIDSYDATDELKNKAKKLFDTNSRQQIANVSRVSGVLHSGLDAVRNNVKEGMIIGEISANSPSYNVSSITHVTTVVKKNGNLMIAQSTSDNNAGVTLTTVDDYFSRAERLGKHNKLFSTDAFLAIKNTLKSAQLVTNKTEIIKPKEFDKFTQLNDEEKAEFASQNKLLNFKTSLDFKNEFGNNQDYLKLFSGSEQAEWFREKVSRFFGDGHNILRDIKEKEIDDIDEAIALKQQFLRVNYNQTAVNVGFNSLNPTGRKVGDDDYVRVKKEIDILKAYKEKITNGEITPAEYKVNDLGTYIEDIKEKAGSVEKKEIDYLINNSEIPKSKRNENNEIKELLKVKSASYSQKELSDIMSKQLVDSTVEKQKMELQRQNDTISTLVNNLTANNQGLVMNNTNNSNNEFEKVKNDTTFQFFALE